MDPTQQNPLQSPIYSYAQWAGNNPSPQQPHPGQQQAQPQYANWASGLGGGAADLVGALMKRNQNQPLPSPANSPTGGVPPSMLTTGAPGSAVSTGFNPNTPSGLF